MSTTCTGYWENDYRILQEINLEWYPNVMVMRCTGCDDRMVIIDGTRDSALEDTYTDHPDYHVAWIDDVRATADDRARLKAAGLKSWADLPDLATDDYVDIPDEDGSAAYARMLERRSETF